MRIRCPECHLERDIHPESVPAGAVTATCPQCKTKFRLHDHTVSPASPAQPGDIPADMPHTGATSPVSPPVSPPVSAPVLTPVSAKIPPVAPDAPRAVPVRLGSPKKTEGAEPRAEHGPEHGAEHGEIRSAKPLTDAAPRTPSARPAEDDFPRSLTETPAQRLRREAPGDSDADPADASLDVPWEQPERYGQLGGLYQTIIRALFGAPKFFAALPRCRGSIMRPLLFYVLLGLFQVLVKMMWFKSVDPSLTDPRVQELISSADMTFAMTFIVSPGILAVQLFLYSALFFLMLRLVQPESAQFPIVLRVVAYSSATLIMSAVPGIGPVVAMVWFAASCFMGCRFAMNIPWHKVALALVPLYLIGFAITMQFVQHLLSQG